MAAHRIVGARPIMSNFDNARNGYQFGTVPTRVTSSTIDCLAPRTHTTTALPGVLPQRALGAPGCAAWIRVVAREKVSPPLPPKSAKGGGHLSR